MPAGRPSSLLLLAVAAGLSVANLYYAQPLAAQMALSFGVSEGAIGLSLMASQLGYALGMLLLVPLGDGRERRRLMVQTALATSFAALLVATAPSYVVLLGASLVLGLCSCLPQLLVPFAVALVRPEQRATAIGTVMSGLLTGILLSRALSGVLGAALGWRWTFVGAAVVMAALALVLRFGLEQQRPVQSLGWQQIVRSLPGVLRTEPLLRHHAWLGALGFGSFSAFWATLSFWLVQLGEGPRTAGMFGVLGIAGIAAAALVGHLGRIWSPARINAVSLAGTALAFVIFALAARSLTGLALGTVLLDVGMQANHLVNQNVIFGLRPELRNRINAIYMVSFFIGGAAGTAAASLAWEVSAWNGVCVVGALMALLGVAQVARARHQDARRAMAATNSLGQ